VPAGEHQSMSDWLIWLLAIVLMAGVLAIIIPKRDNHSFFTLGVMVICLVVVIAVGWSLSN
jgi:hypothetical protein